MTPSNHYNGDHASIRGPFPIVQQGTHVTTRVLPCADRITTMATSHRSGTPSPLYFRAHMSQRGSFHAQIASSQWRPRIDPGPLPHCTTGDTRHNEGATMRRSHHQNGNHASIRDPLTCWPIRLPPYRSHPADPTLPPTLPKTLKKKQPHTNPLT